MVQSNLNGKEDANMLNVSVLALLNTTVATYGLTELLALLRTRQNWRISCRSVKLL